MPRIIRKVRRTVCAVAESKVYALTTMSQPSKKDSSIESIMEATRMRYRRGVVRMYLNS
ncbi:MAG TPA: hypothetical protein PLH80_02045 [Spirochaetota bacterium]|nr:hypothetical protein [Spirochaetota bacterium]HQI37329.1 hypothetical protein [Spirochaetota bacterium]HRR59627.1 hypothetical protein [Spirochaetota bacterium]